MAALSWLQSSSLSKKHSKLLLEQMDWKRGFWDKGSKTTGRGNLGWEFWVVCRSFEFSQAYWSLSHYILHINTDEYDSLVIYSII